MKARTIRMVVAIASVSALAAFAPAGAHPGHAAPIITIDRPAAGTLYQNNVQQPGQIQQLGTLQNPAASIGDALTITFKWTCPPVSTTAVVSGVVNDANGNPVFGGGSLFTAPSGTYSTTWPHGTSGTYTIRATLQCMHTEHDPRTGETKTIGDGGDLDQRAVIVIAE